jgi:hypothetical protein
LTAAALTSARLPVELATVLGADNGELAMRLSEGIVVASMVTYASTSRF